MATTEETLRIVLEGDQAARGMQEMSGASRTLEASFGAIASAAGIFTTVEGGIRFGINALKEQIRYQEESVRLYQEQERAARAYLAAIAGADPAARERTQREVEKLSNEFNIDQTVVGDVMSKAQGKFGGGAGDEQAVRAALSAQQGQQIPAEVLLEAMVYARRASPQTPPGQLADLLLGTAKAADADSAQEKAALLSRLPGLIASGTNPKGANLPLEDVLIRTAQVARDKSEGDRSVMMWQQEIRALGETKPSIDGLQARQKLEAARRDADWTATREIMHGAAGEREAIRTTVQKSPATQDEKIERGIRDADTAKAADPNRDATMKERIQYFRAAGYTPWQAEQLARLWWFGSKTNPDMLPTPSARDIRDQSELLLRGDPGAYYGEKGYRPGDVKLPGEGESTVPVAPASGVGPTSRPVVVNNVHHGPVINYGAPSPVARVTTRPATANAAALP